MNLRGVAFKDCTLPKDHRNSLTVASFGGGDRQARIEKPGIQYGNFRIPSFPPLHPPVSMHTLFCMALDIAGACRAVTRRRGRGGNLYRLRLLKDFAKLCPANI